MALAISTETIFKTFTISLFGLDDPNWRDNTWLVEHLRHLADTIERDDLDIYSVSVTFDRQYKAPNLTINTSPKRG